MQNFKRTRFTCFYTYLAMSSVFALPPMLFVTFHEMYGVSYTLLGSLVFVNFITQLGVDLLFTFFTKHFNIPLTVKTMPLITTLGLVIYAVMPMLAPEQAYLWLVIGTIVFSVASGLSEVLLSPVVAALPSETPERDMSLLHSLYAYGVVTVVVISTLYLEIFGTRSWMYLALFWAALPVVSFVLFSISPMPDSIIAEGKSENRQKKWGAGIFLCAFCIFLGGASENAMTNWISGFMEKALYIPKTVGDLLGMTSFAILLGVGRTLYGKFGRNIFPIMLLGMGGAVVCYFVAGLSTIPVLAMIACVLVGLCTSMLWPGTLIFMEEKFPAPGVAAYALMAAGGDLGNSIAPQLVGIVVDNVTASEWAASFGEKFMLTAEQVGMKAGMLTASLFPIAGLILLLYMKRYFSKKGG